MDAMAGESRIVSGERTRSHAELIQRAVRAAGGLARLGVGAGDTVALLLRNDFPFLEASLAAGMLGARPVPINWHFQADEVGYVLRNCEARVLVGHGDLLAGVSEAVPADVTVLGVPTPPEHLTAYGLPEAADALPAGVQGWDAWLADHAPRAQTVPTPPGPMLYTGGTTGRPKGVRYEAPTPAQIDGMAAMRDAVFGIRPGMRTVLAAPLYHSAPFSFAAGALRAQAHIVLQPRFDATDLLALIEQHRITHLYAVPTMFVRLLRLPEAERRRHSLASLQWVMHAAAPCPPEVKQAMIDWWGPVIHEAYAATEMGWLTHCTSEEAQARPGTVGRLIPGAVARIYDEDGQVLPTGEVGEVYGKHTSMPDFTYHGLDDKRRAIERDGLVTAGDMGYFDEEGYLYLCDRRIDMIISGGVNIYPAEIEAVLITMPGVADCAVFGIPDAEFGETVAAAVQTVPGESLTAEGVQGFLRERIAHYKVPRLVAFHDALPRLDSGKLLKRRLRDPYWQGTGRTI